MKSKIVAWFLGIFLFVANPVKGIAQTEPVVLGRAVERLQVGKLLHRDDFDSLERWVVQIEEKDGFPEPKVAIENGTLDCRLPGRGCTIWYKQKLKNRLAITYEVVCPKLEAGSKSFLPRDVNNFWLASDPVDPVSGLFDAERYAGDFISYHKMNGYYASTGGGKNTTTRMRRYPREKEELPAKHIALNDRDGKSEYMISPGKTQRVQLVAFDDLIQYIVDGKLVYEIAYGDDVATEKVLGRRKKQQGNERYDAETFPFYQEGFFGFRMVGTHHIYSKFRVYQLEPAQQSEHQSDPTSEAK